ncbi:menaquinone-dependent protoporphyrinogen IX dehydrogenase [Shewanella ulleungensis]|uniref:Protoporphyrinogen IX dehydrogenase [quinone] n=1 Tax=Shewanella ulleungensis TaxID=2282699 RepID=A0ABQ2QLL9_9GAMM|nr:menaquinone-dependent protoporphyrinogen IX dehydrogenase [Shewanella ulleungensis]MCL1150115.1 menaquinone-dependent protoporphyrinogen IX dehydrogenase [Shewanella ulleungensis]GGP86715.1 oxygen-independent protoporphyrinogen oxidase HemG [Shewanella ulleungensis]
MSHILLIHSSVHGYTQKICEYLRDKLETQQQQVTVAPLSNVPDLDAFDKVFIGASIRHGKHRPALYQFIDAHQQQLLSKPSGFFSVSLVARKPAKNTPLTNSYMQQFLSQSPWQPKVLQVFGGNLDYQGYGAMDRNIIRFIMWITKGPTDPNTKVEFTDWEKVDQFAQQMIEAS